jgi:PAS domain S-box-containing protein
MMEACEHMSFEGDAPAAAEEAVIKDRRELALVAVERTRMPMVVSDPTQPDNPIVLANQAFFDLTGYTADEVLGRNCRFLQGPDTAPSAIEAIRRGLATGQHFVEVELLNYRKDGSSFWNQLVISPVHDEDGSTIYYFASQKDSSSIRLARELATTEKTLLKEVDHRSMNALALVESILKLTKADRVEDFSTAVQGRVAAIASAHRLLSEGNWAGAELRDLAQRELGSLDIEFSGPETRLPPHVVQPLALILHELRTNAQVHGALSEPDGHVSLHWRADDLFLWLSWEEASEGNTKPVLRPGLGLRIVKNVVQAQLAGELNLAPREIGLKAEFKIPLDRRLAT